MDKEKIREYHRKYRKEHPEKRKQWAKKYYQRHKTEQREYYLNKEYSITAEEYNNLFIAQDAKCAICGEKETTNGSLHVDHNHKTNKIRGLLCGRCNRGIGSLQDNIVILRSAIEYLGGDV